MSKSGSRIPAPSIEPIIIEDIRYEQVKNGLTAGLDQMGGYLAAYDINTNELLWTLKIYDNARTSDKEGDVQDVFFKSMKLLPEGNLLIVNEKRMKFKVDLTSKNVTKVP